MSRLGDAFRRSFIEPAVKAETRELRKDLERARTALSDGTFSIMASTKGSATEGLEQLGWEELGAGNRALMKKYFSWAYANITVIAAKVADICLESYRLDSKGDVTEVENHPLLELISRVNDYQTKWDLVFSYMVNMLMQGEAVWYLVGCKNEKSQPTEIWSLHPEYIKVIPGDLSQNEFVKRYEYRQPGKPMLVFAPYEILFFKEPNPSNDYRGFGVLQAAAADVDIDFHATEWNRSFFENSAQPDGVLMTEQKLSETVYERLLRKWNDKFRGSRNAGKTAVLEQGLKFQVVSQTAKDMDFNAQQQWIRDKIMAMFKNTKTVLGIVEDVNRANAEASESVWIKHNIKPKMERFVGLLNEFLMPRYSETDFIGFDDPSPESEEDDLNEWDKAVNRWLTVNEVRAEQGLDPVEGGDYLYVPLTSTPINSAGQTVPAIGTEGVHYIRLKAKSTTGLKQKRLRARYQNEIKTIQLRQYRKKVNMELIKKAFNTALIQELQKKIKGLQDDGRFSIDAKQAHWGMMVKLTTIFETHVIKLVQSIIDRHKEVVLKRLKNNYNPKKGINVKSGEEEFLPADDAYVKVSIDALTPIIKTLVRQQGRHALESLGIDTELAITNAIKKSINRFIDRASKSYVKTMRERIGAKILTGINSGWSAEKMQREIRAEYDDLSRPTAIRLARSETVRAANFAQQEAFKVSQIVEGKEWFTAEDEHVCPYCEPLDGKIFGLDDNFVDDGTDLPGNDGTTFSVDYGDVEYPPLHANCRCFLAPVLSRRSVQSRVVNKLRPALSSKGKHQTSFDEAVSERVKEVLAEARSQMELDMDAKLATEIEKLTEEVRNALTS